MICPQTLVTAALLPLFACGLLGQLAIAQNQNTPPDPDAAYQLGPDSSRQEGVPVGKVTKHQWTSQIFPETTREFFVYIPAQYNGTQPACLMVFQDGHAYVDENGQFRAPVVFDNLIHRGELPVTIGLFVNPGHSGGPIPDNRWRAANRSFEYDTLSDQYARFLQLELIPHIVSELQLNLLRGSSRPSDLRHFQWRHLCLHRSLGTPRMVQQSAQPRRQLHQYPRRTQLPGLHPKN
jgi:hypothetical protein